MRRASFQSVKAKALSWWQKPDFYLAFLPRRREHVMDSSGTFSNTGKALSYSSVTPPVQHAR
jgi:hypothetical protein